ncbi:MAG: TolC family protein [Planctomycetota bacterium]
MTNVMGCAAVIVLLGMMCQIGISQEPLRKPRRLPPVSKSLAARNETPTIPAFNHAQRSDAPTERSLSTELPDPLRGGDDADLHWWDADVVEQVLDRSRWVSFDLETVLLDTLANSPRVLAVGFGSSATFQRVVQQDAAFDATMLLSSDLGATNDPVGNTLVTGGADRLRERTLAFRGGARKLTRRGTELEWSQELGFEDSNSDFFLPDDQGNSRLSLNLTKPLLSRGGRYYNERLVTQARIDNRVVWQEFRSEVEQRIAEVMTAYWQLYRSRAQLTQQRALLTRSQEIERLLTSRRDFDAARIEIVKAKQRVARRADQLIDLEAELRSQQVRLASLVGSDSLLGADTDLELIPISPPEYSPTHYSLRDAVAQALQFRPEIRSATADVQSSALELRVTRVELEPQLNWVLNGYLSQLNGSSQAFRSLGEQFVNAPSVSTSLEFELPVGRRAAKAAHREAVYRAKQRSQQLREVIQETQLEVQTALIDLDRFGRQLLSKRKVLATAIVEENILTTQWRIIGGDDSRAGIKLENLLDAQQRRTDAEKDLVEVESAYMIALIRLQRSMGTLLIDEGLQPSQSRCSGEIQFPSAALRPKVEASESLRASPTDFALFTADPTAEGGQNIADAADSDQPLDEAPNESVAISDPLELPPPEPSPRLPPQTNNLSTESELPQRFEVSPHERLDVKTTRHPETRPTLTPPEHRKSSRSFWGWK